MAILAFDLALSHHRKSATQAPKANTGQFWIAMLSGILLSPIPGGKRPEIGVTACVADMGGLGDQDGNHPHIFARQCSQYLALEAGLTRPMCILSTRTPHVVTANEQRLDDIGQKQTASRSYPFDLLHFPSPTLYPPNRSYKNDSSHTA